MITTSGIESQRKSVMSTISKIGSPTEISTTIPTKLPTRLITTPLSEPTTMASMPSPPPMPEWARTYITAHPNMTYDRINNRVVPNVINTREYRERRGEYNPPSKTDLIKKILPYPPIRRDGAKPYTGFQTDNISKAMTMPSTTGDPNKTSMKSNPYGVTSLSSIGAKLKTKW